MAMGTRKKPERQDPLWYDGELAQAPGYPFYCRLNAAAKAIQLALQSWEFF